MGWLTEIRLRRGNVERRPKHHPIPAGARGLPWPLAPSGIGESGGGRQERQPRTTARRPPRLARPTVSMGDVTCALALVSLSFATCSHHR